MSSAVELRPSQEDGGDGLTLTLDPESGVSWRRESGEDSSLLGRFRQWRRRRREHAEAAFGLDAPRESEGLVPWARVLSVQHLPPSGVRSSSSSPSRLSTDAEAPPFSSPLVVQRGAHDDHDSNNSAAAADWLPPPKRRTLCAHPSLHTVAVFFADTQAGRGGATLLRPRAALLRTADGAAAAAAAALAASAAGRLSLIHI